jgi:diaminohydroxyphosphoribosylaminopyrimidine deaminase / 5-amino-6-(5-phosphoribosylamino)uracil reductase
VDTHDIRFLQHAVALARKGTALASPNPMVGCVIVSEGHFVGEGFHQYEWRDHAEIVALKSAGAKARGATLYVSLEPCNHTGRTGPCSEAIIAAGISRVVAAIEDPNPKTSGRGFERLRSAGVEVESGVLEVQDEASRLIEAFSCWIRTKRPFVTLKSALTLDGQLALPKKKNSSPTEWVSSDESRDEVQRIRHSSDALLTGIGTILADNPLLTDRSGLPRRRRLLRVILDSKLRLPEKSRIVETADDDLLVFTAASLKSPKARRLQSKGMELVHARARQGRIDLSAVLAELGRRDILSVLLEAGPSLNGSAIAASLVDKFILFFAPKIAGHAKVPLARLAADGPVQLRRIQTQTIGPDLRVEGYPQPKPRVQSR